MNNPLCPICGSPSYKSGFDKRAVKPVQTYQCKKCGRRFRETYVLNVKTNPKYDANKKPRRSRKRRFKLKEPIPDLSVLFKKPIDVESIVEIPCFCCEENPCDPNTCEKLTEWLVKNAS